MKRSRADRVSRRRFCSARYRPPLVARRSSPAARRSSAARRVHPTSNKRTRRAAAAAAAAARAHSPLCGAAARWHPHAKSSHFFASAFCRIFFLCGKLFVFVSLFRLRVVAKIFICLYLQKCWTNRVYAFVGCSAADGCCCGSASARFGLKRNA